MRSNFSQINIFLYFCVLLSISCQEIKTAKPTFHAAQPSKLSNKNE